jgi:hypothetical protein
MTTTNTEFKRLEKENDRIRLEINKIVLNSSLEGEEQEKLIELINNLIENELLQEGLSRRTKGEQHK